MLPVEPRTVIWAGGGGKTETRAEVSEPARAGPTNGNPSGGRHPWRSPIRGTIGEITARPRWLAPPRRLLTAGRPPDGGTSGLDLARQPDARRRRVVLLH